MVLKDFKCEKRKGGKLDKRYFGPFIISAVLSRSVYQFTSQDGKNVLTATGAYIKAYKQANSVSVMTTGYNQSHTALFKVNHEKIVLLLFLYHTVCFQ